MQAELSLLTWLRSGRSQITASLSASKDDLSGRVRLRREELTGALAPLRDPQFFERVLIDSGAVAWPGEIDLAPDAMYAEVAGRPHEPQQARPWGGPPLKQADTTPNAPFGG